MEADLHHGQAAIARRCRHACAMSVLMMCLLPSAMALPGAADEVQVAGQAGTVQSRMSGLHAFPWPEGSRYSQILHGTRWQGCELDAAVFESGLDPVVLASQVAASLAERPGVLAAVSPLVLDWHDGVRHWIMRIGAGADGGAQGSVSAWSLADCIPDRLADPQAPRQSQRLLDWQDAMAGRQVRQSVYLHAGQGAAVVQARWRAALLRQGWRMGCADVPAAAGWFSGLGREMVQAEPVLADSGHVSPGLEHASQAGQCWTKPDRRLHIVFYPDAQGWIAYLHQDTSDGGGAAAEVAP